MVNGLALKQCFSTLLAPSMLQQGQKTTLKKVHKHLKLFCMKALTNNIKAEWKNKKELSQGDLLKGSLPCLEGLFT